MWMKGASVLWGPLVPSGSYLQWDFSLQMGTTE